MIEPSSFEVGDAPDGLRFWRLSNPPHSSEFGGPVEVVVLLERLELTDLDFTLIDAVVNGVDRYLAAAEAFVAGRVRADPAFFGVTSVGERLGLGQPEVTFSDASWLVRFAEAPFPIAEPFGLLVEFEGDTPVDVAGTADADKI